MDETDIGLEQRADGKWTCTMCYVNTIKFPQPNLKKKAPEPPRPTEPEKPKLKDQPLFSS